MSFPSVGMGKPKKLFKGGVCRQKSEGFENFDFSRESPKLSKCEDKVVQSPLGIKSEEEKDVSQLPEHSLTENGNGCSNDREFEKEAEKACDGSHVTKKKSKKRKWAELASDPEEELHLSTEKPSKKKKRGNKKLKRIKESHERCEMKETIEQKGQMKQTKQKNRLDKKEKNAKKDKKKMREESDEEEGKHTDEEDVTNDRKVNKKVKRKEKKDRNMGKKDKQEQIEKEVTNEQKKWKGQKVKTKLDGCKNRAEFQQTPHVAEGSVSSLESKKNEGLGRGLCDIFTPNEHPLRVERGDRILSDSRKIHHYSGPVQGGKDEKDTETDSGAAKSLGTGNDDVGGDVGSSTLNQQKPASRKSFEKLQGNGLPRSGRRSVEHQTGTPFKRVLEDQISFENECLMDNSFHSKNDTYGIRAHHDLVVTKGKGFRKEKTKKKRLNHHGGKINYEVNSYQFSDSD